MENLEIVGANKLEIGLRQWNESRNVIIGSEPFWEITCVMWFQAGKYSTVDMT